MKRLVLILLIILISGPSFAAVSAFTVWEVRTAGSDTNGGGFVAGAAGTDYSQQNAKNTTGSNISTTDAVANGTTTITSATAAFTSAITGNIIYLGTARYQATYASAVSITVDRTVATGTGLTLNIGGAVADLPTIATSVVAGNYVYVKNDGVYTTATGYTWATSGSFTAGTPIRIIGYTTTRGDAGTPTFQATSGSQTVWNVTGSEVYTSNFILDCNSQSSCSPMSQSGSLAKVSNVSFRNFTLDAVNAIGSGVSFSFIEITGGVSGCTLGFNSTQTNQSVYNANIHDNACPASNLDSTSIMYSVISNNTGSSSNGVVAGFGSQVISNTIYGNGGSCIVYSGGNDVLGTEIHNNICDSNGGYGLTASTAIAATAQFDGNAYYNNALGNLNNVNSTTGPAGVAPYTYAHNVILTTDPFVNPSGGNFALNNTAGGGLALKGTGVPATWLNLSTTTGSPSFGAVGPALSTMAFGGTYTFGQ